MITEQMAQAYETDPRVMRAIEALTGGDFSSGRDDDPAIAEWRDGYLPAASLTKWLDDNEHGWRAEAPLSWGAGRGVSPVMVNLTDIDDDDLLEQYRFGDDLTEAHIDGFVSDDNPNRMHGYSDLVAYWPTAGRAAHVSNGDPRWYDARSLEDAIEQAQAEYQQA